VKRRVIALAILAVLTIIALALVITSPAPAWHHAHPAEVAAA